MIDHQIQKIKPVTKDPLAYEDFDWLGSSQIAKVFRTDQKSATRWLKDGDFPGIYTTPGGGRRYVQWRHVKDPAKPLLDALRAEREAEARAAEPGQ